jgi:CheY-like chemotaxis protein
MENRPQVPAGAPSAQESKTDPASRRVLVVDDYEDNRDLYSEYLGYVGFDVAVAANGEDALSQATDGQPDVILMDLSLPLMDGWEAIKRLKEDPRTRSIPVIAITGHVMPDHVARAKEAGCDDFCAKPCLPEDVEQRIRKLLKPSKRKSA